MATLCMITTICSKKAKRERLYTFNGNLSCYYLVYVVEIERPPTNFQMQQKETSSCCIWYRS